jgi:hypothetical protein
MVGLPAIPEGLVIVNGLFTCRDLTCANPELSLMRKPAVAALDIVVSIGDSGWPPNADNAPVLVVVPVPPWLTGRGNVMTRPVLGTEITSPPKPTVVVIVGIWVLGIRALLSNVATPLATPSEDTFTLLVSDGCTWSALGTVLRVPNDTTPSILILLVLAS